MNTMSGFFAFVTNAYLWPIYLFKYFVVTLGVTISVILSVKIFCQVC